VIAILNLIWMPFVAFYGIAVPDSVLTLPVLATFVVMLVHFMVLYRTRVQAPIFASLGAAVSAMSLQLSVGRAVAEGLVKDNLPFVRTAKGGGLAQWAESFPAFWEGVLGMALLIGSLTLAYTNDQAVREVSIFSAVMLVQSLPFLAAVGIALFERSSLNEFSTWRRLGARFVQIPRLPTGTAPTGGPTAGGGIGAVQVTASPEL
ncbi:MAG: glycosyl transferase family 2, partial [Methyloceanibacter sp.]